MQNQISQVFWTFLLLTEEVMASCSSAFRKPKNSQEERNLIENATPKSTRVVTKSSLKIFLECQNGWENTNPLIWPIWRLSHRTFGRLNLSKNCAKRMVKGVLPGCCTALCGISYNVKEPMFISPVQCLYRPF